MQNTSEITLSPTVIHHFYYTVSVQVCASVYSFFIINFMI